jgi:hypothetical protein
MLVFLLQASREFRDQIMRVKGGDDTVPFILIGNKSDLEAQRQVPLQTAKDLVIWAISGRSAARPDKTFQIEIL